MVQVEQKGSKIKLVLLLYWLFSICWLFYFVGCNRKHTDVISWRQSPASYTTVDQDCDCRRIKSVVSCSKYLCWSIGIITDFGSNMYRGIKNSFKSAHSWQTAVNEYVSPPLPFKIKTIIELTTNFEEPEAFFYHTWKYPSHSYPDDIQAHMKPWSSSKHLLFPCTPLHPPNEISHSSVCGLLTRNLIFRTFVIRRYFWAPWNLPLPPSLHAYLCFFLIFANLFSRQIIRDSKP